MTMRSLLKAAAFFVLSASALAQTISSSGFVYRDTTNHRIIFNSFGFLPTNPSVVNDSLTLSRNAPDKSDFWQSYVLRDTAGAITLSGVALAHASTDSLGSLFVVEIYNMNNVERDNPIYADRVGRLMARFYMLEKAGRRFRVDTLSYGQIGGGKKVELILPKRFGIAIRKEPLAQAPSRDARWQNIYLLESKKTTKPKK